MSLGIVEAGLLPLGTGGGARGFSKLPFMAIRIRPIWLRYVGIPPRWDSETYPYSLWDTSLEMLALTESKVDTVPPRRRYGTFREPDPQLVVQ